MVRKVTGNRSVWNVAIRRKQLQKTTLILVSMATTFVVTWFPVHIGHYFSAFPDKLGISFFF